MFPLDVCSPFSVQALGALDVIRALLLQAAGEVVPAAVPVTTHAWRQFQEQFCDPPSKRLPATSVWEGLEGRRLLPQSPLMGCRGGAAQRSSAAAARPEPGLQRGSAAAAQSGRLGNTRPGRCRPLAKPCVMAQMPVPWAGQGIC
jgi:hypothetical protein